MKISMCASYKPPQPLVNFPREIRNMDPFMLMPWRRKDKVVIVMGATGTGKSRLSIDLATRFSGEIINSDKMQVYEGLDIVTNKVTQEERRGIPHHLLGVVDSNADFTAVDFRQHASRTVEFIARRDRLPIIAGGSNSYIKSLINHEFQSRYECCFLWVDASLHVLKSFVSERVDRMVRAGLVDEVRQFFKPKSDYTRGLRRAIGVPELDEFLRAEEEDEIRARLLEIAIHKIKNNTCKLATRQLKNITSLQNQTGWQIHRLDATEAFRKCGPESDEAWERHVAIPSAKIVDNFLNKQQQDSAPTPYFIIINKILPQLLPLSSRPHRW